MNLLTLQEIAKMLKVPVSWIYARTGEKAENTIPHIRLGKYLRFEETEVMQWIKDQQQQRR